MENVLMLNEEIITMLRYECDWARKKKEMMVEQATTYLLWDASMIGFAIYFLDIKKIYNSVFNDDNHITCVLVIIAGISLLLCFVAGTIYFKVMQVRKMENVEIDEYKNGYTNEKLIEDYELIIKDYDSTIKEYGNKLTNANKCLFVSVVLLVITIIVLKIII